jgi:thiol-disulfide isomerase/thioredoxin
MVLALFCWPATGCHFFSKKDSGGGNAFLGNGTGAAATDKPKPVETGDPLLASSAGSGQLDGLIAGQVIDARTGKVCADARLRWVCLDDPKEEEAPIDVQGDSQGYFTISGLKSGRQYKLVAKAKSGDRTMTGITITRVPNSKLLILVSEDFNSPVNPGAAQPGKGADKTPKKTTGNPAEVPASAQAPGWTPGLQQAAPQPPPVYGTDPSKIAENYAVRPPTVNIKGAPQAPPVPVTTPPARSPQEDHGPSNAPSVKIAQPVPPSTAAAPVPSCVLVGKKLDNFALLDTSLLPWEYRAKKAGKLMLLDFWSTTCPPCRDAVYTLKMLQSKYGAQGLEVIGIAYEEGTPAEQARRVTDTGLYFNVNYPLLLGGGNQCPVRRSFQVERFPTLVLVDDAGLIVWRHEGALDRTQIDDLDFRIKGRLMK